MSVARTSARTRPDLAARGEGPSGQGAATPHRPHLRGIERFAGPMMHTACWDEAYDWSGLRVAVIGTGATAIARVPELVRTARSVEVFQRTAPWVLPRLEGGLPEGTKASDGRVPTARGLTRGLLDRAPFRAGLEAAVRAHLRLAVRDAWLRRQLTPDFRAGCKRLHFSSDYYPALQAASCKLITWPIATVVPKGIRTADGIERWFDCIVFATGVDGA